MVKKRDIEEGQVVAGKYRVLRQLGEGGMGAVYLVENEKTDERFAMKMLHPSVVQNAAALERFRREARTPARIDSDHVCRVVDSDVAAELDGAPFLVMEYLRGRDLQALSEEVGKLDPREVIVYLRQVAMALDRAHSLGIVHRDLKPENVFLTLRDDGSPCVKVLDFGIAKLTGATGDLARVKATQTGDIFGTPLYMAPEQCKSEAEKVGPQTDVWALGMIAQRLLTGDDFWTAHTLTHLIAQIAYEIMPAASARGATLGPAYDEWFAKCCAREAAERFASAGDAVKTLAEVLGYGSTSATDMLVTMRATQRARESALIMPEPTSARLKQTSVGLTKDGDSHDPVPKSRRVALYAAVAAAMAAVAGVLLWAGGLAGGRRPSPSSASVGAARDAAPNPSAVQARAATAVPHIAAVPAPPPPSAEPTATATASAATAAASGPRPVTAQTIKPPPRATATAAVAAPPTASPAPPTKKDSLGGRH